MRRRRCRRRSIRRGRGVSLRTATMNLDQEQPQRRRRRAGAGLLHQPLRRLRRGELSIPTLRDGLDKVMAQTMARVSGLRTTMSDRAFSLVYQPIVDLAHAQDPSRRGARPLSRRRLARRDRRLRRGGAADRRFRSRGLRQGDRDGASSRRIPAFRSPSTSPASRSRAAAFSNMFFGLLNVDRNLSRRILFEVTELAVDHPRRGRQRPHPGAARRRLQGLPRRFRRRRQLVPLPARLRGRLRQDRRRLRPRCAAQSARCASCCARSLRLLPRNRHRARSAR